MVTRKDFEISKKGIPFKVIENMNISQVKKLDKDYRKLIGGKK